MKTVILIRNCALVRTMAIPLPEVFPWIHGARKPVGTLPQTITKGALELKGSSVVDGKTGALIFGNQEGKVFEGPFFKNIVGSQYVGWSVLEFYSFRYRHSPPGKWRAWIDEGRVYLNGVRSGTEDYNRRNGCRRNF